MRNLLQTTARVNVRLLWMRFFNSDMSFIRERVEPSGQTSKFLLAQAFQIINQFRTRVKIFRRQYKADLKNLTTRVPTVVTVDNVARLQVPVDGQRDVSSLLILELLWMKFRVIMKIIFKVPTIKTMLMQEILSDDPVQFLDFSQSIGIFLVRSCSDRHLRGRLFHPDGIVNKQNCRFWANKNTENRTRSFFIVNILPCVRLY